MLKLICIFYHVLIVNSRCYGRCYVKKLIPMSTFLKFHTHLDENSVRSFQNVFNKSSRVLTWYMYFQKIEFSWTPPYFRVPYPLNRRWKGEKGERLAITAGWLRKIDLHDTAEISPALFPAVTVTGPRWEPIRLHNSLPCPLGKK